MLVNRRDVLAAAAAAGVVAVSPLSLVGALAQAAPSTAELMAEGPLKDIWLGKPDAPVTMIEYASLTCSHCATFHNQTYPTLKSKYIDTGKVRFVMREFPLDPLALAGSMLARCAGDDKRNSVVELLFARQTEWLVDKPVAALMNVVKQAGFTQESFESCLKNQELYDAVSKTRDRASEKFGINSTPTFFINGKKQAGAITVDELDKLLAPYLKS
ncbi:MAG: DsbA family protein [Methylobacteriaceae bacterium]|nr:DsbA family protein [Methylobacteriaceae bacterium]